MKTFYLWRIIPFFASWKSFFAIFYISTFWGLKIRSLPHESGLRMIHATGATSTLQFMIFFHLKVLLHCAIHIFIHEIHCYYISLSVVYWFPINTFQPGQWPGQKKRANEEIILVRWEILLHLKNLWLGIEAIPAMVYENDTTIMNPIFLIQRFQIVYFVYFL